MAQTAPTPKKTSLLRRLFTRKPVMRKTVAGQQTHQPERPKLSRRERRDQPGGYEPVLFNLDVTGLNHKQRRSYYASRKGKAVDDGRKKKRIRGEYCGRKLERLIRAGAPLHVVQKLRYQIRDFLDKQ
jgi:hypothetical protein